MNVRFIIDIVININIIITLIITIIIIFTDVFDVVIVVIIITRVVIIILPLSKLSLYHHHYQYRDHPSRSCYALLSLLLSLSPLTSILLAFVVRVVVSSSRQLSTLFFITISCCVRNISIRGSSSSISNKRNRGRREEQHRRRPCYFSLLQSWPLSPAFIPRLSNEWQGCYCH